MSDKPRAHLVHLNRALSKLGVLTRSQATTAILAGSVIVDGRVVRDPAYTVTLGVTRIAVDGEQARAVEWRTILLNKPRQVVTTRSDPEGRKTVFDVIGPDAEGLVPVGRLDLATTGLLLLTTDTMLADWITDPRNAVRRVYVVTVKGRLTADSIQTMIDGVRDRQGAIKAEAVSLLKESGRESHVTIELSEGKNREVRRLTAAVGHQVTRLKRIRLGGLELGDLAPGAWRDLTHSELAAAFPQPRV